MNKVDKVAVALNNALKKVDRNFGMHHPFVIRWSKVDGTEATVTEIVVVAISWSDAWSLIGTAIGEFMNDEHGRVVHSIKAVL